MKRSLIILCAALAFISFSTGQDAYAVSYEFNLNPGDLNLNHNKAYTWGFNVLLKENESITKASLTLEGINNWKVEPDALYVHLLDNPLTGIRSINDQNNIIADYFSGQGTYLFTYSDTNNTGPNQSQNGAEDPTYDFTGSNLTTFVSYLSTVPATRYANVGFALDPDCRYYFTEIKFTVWTEIPTGGVSGNDIPEPGTLILLGAGLTGLAFFRRYNLKK